MPPPFQMPLPPPFQMPLPSQVLSPSQDTLKWSSVVINGSTSTFPDLQMCPLTIPSLISIGSGSSGWQREEMGTELEFGASRMASKMSQVFSGHIFFPVPVGLLLPPSPICIRFHIRHTPQVPLQSTAATSDLQPPLQNREVCPWPCYHLPQTPTLLQP